MPRSRRIRLKRRFYTLVEAKLAKLSRVVLVGARSAQNVTESVRSYTLKTMVLFLVAIPLSSFVTLLLKASFFFQERIYALSLRGDDLLKRNNGAVDGDPFVGVDNRANTVLDAREGRFCGRDGVNHDVSL